MIKTRLYNAIGIPIAICLSFATAALLWWTYSTSVSAINHELERDFEQKSAIISHILSSDVKGIRQGLSEISNSLHVQGVLAEEHFFHLQDRMIDLGNALENPPLDILFANITDEGVTIDATLPFFDSSQFIPAMRQHFRNNPDTEGLLIIDNYVLLVSRQSLLDDHTGRVIGDLFGAVVLNDNLALLDDIRERTNSTLVSMFYDGRLIGATESRDHEYLRHLLKEHEKDLTLEFPGSPSRPELHIDDGLAIGFPTATLDGQSTKLVFGLVDDNATLLEIQRSYRQHLIYIAFISGLFFFLMFLLIRRTTYPSVRQLVGYAKKISEDDLTSTFQEEHIKEFNTIGKAMENMADSLKQSRLLLRNVIESMPSILIGLDDEERVIQWNREAEISTGIPAEKALNRSLKEVQPALHAEIRQTLDDMKGSSSMEQTPIVQTRKKAQRHESITVYPLISNGVSGAVIRIDDVTKREELIEELGQKNEELERFVYTVSHDLKSPVITISGFAGLAMEDLKAGNAERVLNYIQRIESASLRMSELMNNLLELSRVGRIVEPFVSVNARQLVDEALELVHGSLQGRKVDIRIQSPMPLMHVEQKRLLEALVNIFENALKYMPPEFEQIILVETVQDAEYTTLCIEDNGLGIEEKYYDRIFNLFEQLNPKREGSGIGLALVKRIMEHHGGRVWAEAPRELQGARICLCVPIRAGEAEADQAQ